MPSPPDAVYRAVGHRGETDAQVQSDHMLRALDDYSKNRLDNVVHAETAHTLPEFASLVAVLHGSRVRIRWRTLEAKIRSAGKRFDENPRKYLRFLLEYEIIGPANGADRYYADDPAIVDVEPRADMAYVFHPSLEKSLDLKGVYGGKIE